MAKDKGLQIEVRLPKELADQVREVATLAGVAPEDAIKIAIALDVRRWNRESDVRAQRDELLVFAQEAALGAYKPKELRNRAQSIISNVQPND